MKKHRIDEAQPLIICSISTLNTNFDLYHSILMAFNLSLSKPISTSSFISKNLGQQFPNSQFFPGCSSIPRHGWSWNFHYKFYGMQFNSFHMIKNSYKTQPAAIVTEAETADVPILSCSQAIERLRVNVENQERKQHYLAMYSSVFGGITLDPVAMVIPMDDHMVHRGHGVFDTAAIMDGHLYELDQHLDRFLRSTAMAKIKLPFDRNTIRKILIQTVSASKCKKGSLRYWLSAGPGDFQLSPSGCHSPSLYAIVIQDQSPPDYTGIKAVTSSIPIKPPQFAVMKSVNYLPNVLSKMEAEETGAYAAIWLDFDGYIAEGPNMNVGFVTKENELILPEFDQILSGCTALRVLVLAENLVKEGKLKGIQVRKVTVEEGKNADEMMLIGSGVLVRPVVQWDDQVIGNGEDGPVAKALLNLILEDMKSGPPAVRVPVPY